MRNFALNRLDPSYGDLLHRLLTRGASPVPRNEVLRICEPRFQELQRLCAEHHANFVYVVPPGFGFHDDAMAEAGSRAGASVLVPVHNDAWKLEKYRDGFHLSEMGAREFTAIFSPSLNTLLRSFEAAQ